VDDGVIRLTADAPGRPAPHAAWWLYAPEEKSFRRLKRELRKWGVPVNKFRTSGQDYEDRRHGA
jgi:hypothetical protein